GVDPVVVDELLLVVGRRLGVLAVDVPRPVRQEAEGVGQVAAQAEHHAGVGDGLLLVGRQQDHRLGVGRRAGVVRVGGRVEG
ncbi:hypothetical protein DQE84_18155, partial [Staphylococcus warneri]